jgi:hypothetical protein
MSINTLWRTLVRIESFNEDKVSLVLPSWNHRETIELNITELPTEIVEKMKITEMPYRVFARCNIGNDNKEELVFKQWESKD